MRILFAAGLLLALWLTNCAEEATRLTELDAPAGQEDAKPPFGEALDLAQLKLAAGWQRTENLAIAPDGTPSVKTDDEGRILFHAGPSTDPLPLSLPAGDFSLQFDYLLGPGATLALRLPGGQELRLADDDPGQLTGIPPRPPLAPTVRQPGYWQRLELAYRADAGDSALLKVVYLNGNMLHDQVLLAAGEEQPALRGEGGAVAVRNLSYRNQAGRSSRVLADNRIELHLPSLRYQYAELAKPSFAWADLDAITWKKSGYIESFDINSIREAGNRYALRFTGTLHIPVAGRYAFFVETGSAARLLIDNKVVAELTLTDPYGRQFGDPVPLAEGDHRLQLDFYHQQGWMRFNTGYRAPGDAAESLLNSLGEGNKLYVHRVNAEQSLPTDDEAYLLRSFIYHPAPRNYETATKRTHAINVGQRDQPSYTLDLRNGALLQAWRGGFVDVYDMWDNRGEPQTARPVTGPLAFAGRPQWALLARPDAAWPDSVVSTADFQHLRYELDTLGRPTFFYRLNGGEVSDALRGTADGRALQRTLHYRQGSQPAYTTLARGESIEEVRPGHFRVSGPGYAVILSAEQTGLYLRTEGDYQRLVVRLEPGDTVEYQLDW